MRAFIIVLALIALIASVATYVGYRAGNDACEPHPAFKTPDSFEADEGKIDALALVAHELVRQGRLDDARNKLDEGFALRTRDTFGIASLWTVTGELHEARAARLDIGGASAPLSSSDERHLAIEAFDRANQIELILQRRLLEGR